ncbi:MAG: PEP-CTERM sorting domain-containing protein [Rhodoferax sp.]|uniref:PEP-CTERM sorting domain-containing protein n=1 Tax=Rhodoferax sp. TaxID=50421 RepID=UPI002623A348|nr:PEP-CTERM sorting domain-containing protein [Rhodoferax sp.]MDD5333205.1 PEP-CTERM sorting domain-containing protein [Rhodoferax sp.]
MEKQLTTGVVAGLRSGIGSRLRAKAAFCAGATALALAGLTGVTSAKAQSTLVFDRGLPTTNVNSGDANRSNVQWADNESTTNPATFYQPGDDFTLAGTGAYNINTIRVWSTDSTGLSLLGGLAGGPIALQSTSFTSTLVAGYGGGLGYQGSSGGYSPVYQIDFNVNIGLNGGQTYQFFLDGAIRPFTGGTGYTNAFLHASNASQSGSTQEGADGSFLYLSPSGTALTWNSGTGGGTSGWGSGGFPNSDANVQVFAAAVPEPETYAMLLAGLGLLGYVRGRRQPKDVAAA